MRHRAAILVTALISFWNFRFVAAARLCQNFLAPERDASRASARNNIAHFPRWSDQQAKLAEDQMRLFLGRMQRVSLSCSHYALNGGRTLGSRVGRTANY
jgi:hypothetical protein